MIALTPVDDRGAPGETGIWVFVLADFCVFLGFFCAFLYYRVFELEVFQSSQQLLAQPIGLLNTLILLTSSWSVARGVDAVRREDRRLAWRRIGLGLGLGLGFVLIKLFEFYLEVASGHTISTNNFFMFYFMLGGLHLVHVLVGLIVLLVICKLLESDHPGRPAVRDAESGAIYWHMVDAIWLVLFSLVYVLP